MRIQSDWKVPAGPKNPRKSHNDSKTLSLSSTGQRVTLVGEASAAVETLEVERDMGHPGVDEADGRRARFSF